MILCTLEVEQPREAEMIRLWMLIVDILATDRRLPGISTQMRNLIANLAKQYPRFDTDSGTSSGPRSVESVTGGLDCGF